MIDLWTTCDATGNPIGHGCKVGNEYYEQIKNYYNVMQYANKEVIPHLNNPQARPLPTTTHQTGNKIKRFLEIRNNISRLFKTHHNAVFWFYVPELYIHMALASLSKQGEKRIATIFEDYSKNKLKKWFFGQSRKKLDLEIVTNNHLLNKEGKKNQTKQIFIPDYIYDEKYEKYKTYRKKEQVVCLGTMNHMKMLEEMVYSFNKNGMKLLVCGLFEEDTYYEKIKSIANSNIEVRNLYLKEDEYYTLLAESKYCIIPYNPKFYKNRTSGVIQECLFLNTIPITDKRIIEFSGIPGIGYFEISDLDRTKFDCISFEKYYHRFSEIIYEYYNAETTKDKIIAAFNCL